MKANMVNLSKAMHRRLLQCFIELFNTLVQNVSQRFSWAEVSWLQRRRIPSVLYISSYPCATWVLITSTLITAEFLTIDKLCVDLR